MTSRRCIGVLEDGSRCHRRQYGENFYCQRCDERISELIAKARQKKDIELAAANSKNGHPPASTLPGKSS
jgi:hypothetical protein